MTDKLIEMQQRAMIQMQTRLSVEIERTHKLEQAVRNYITVMESMPEFATAADYRRLLAPIQEYAQELLEQEKRT